jgi:hypothetical protein
VVLLFSPLVQIRSGLLSLLGPKLSVAVELSLFNLHHGAGKAYVAQYRDIHANLKDASNDLKSVTSRQRRCVTAMLHGARPHLLSPCMLMSLRLSSHVCGWRPSSLLCRQRVVSGALTPSVLVSMPPQGLASTAMTIEREALRKEAVKNVRCREDVRKSDSQREAASEAASEASAAVMHVSDRRAPLLRRISSTSDCFASGAHHARARFIDECVTSSGALVTGRYGCVVYSVDCMCSLSHAVMCASYHCIPRSSIVFLVDMMLVASSVGARDLAAARCIDDHARDEHYIDR